MKVNLAEVIRIKEEISKLQRSLPRFCKYCLEVDPPCGFYHLAMGHSGDLSLLICNDCAGKIA